MKKWFAVALATGLIAGLTMFLIQPEDAEKAIPHPTGEARPNDWLLRQRSWPSGTINETAAARAFQRAQTMHRNNPKTKDAVYWELVAQNNIGGRISDLAITSDDTIYAGTPSAGLWRSPDLGESWTPLFDHMPTLSAAAFAVAPSKEEVIYLGTGDANGSYNSVWYTGAGVFKSTDRGDSWLPLGLKDTRHIGRIVVHPQDHNTVFVAAMGAIQYEDEHRGLYRSRDGGLTWEKVLFVDNRTGAIDVIIDPQNPDRMYAATWERIRMKFGRAYTGPGSGLHRSLDGGDTWEPMINGLPPSGPDIGRYGITIAPSDPNILYALYAKEDHNLGGCFKSVDGGDTWRRTNNRAMLDMFAGFGWFFANIRVHPTDPDTVFALGVWMYISRDGGRSWQRYKNTLPPALREDPDYAVHVDHHDLVFSPNDPNLAILGNDGGLYRSEGESLIFQPTNNPPDSIFYTCEIDPSDSERFLGGLQDNGVQLTRQGSSQPWQTILGGDGMQIQVHPQDSFDIFTEYQFGSIFHIYRGNYYEAAPTGAGERWEWNTPILRDPNNPDNLFVGSQHLWHAADVQPGVYNWVRLSDDLTDGRVSSSAGSITAIAVAPSDSRTIYVGTNDANVWVTNDFGENWQRIDQDLPERWVTRIDVDPTNPARAYVTFSGYYDVDYQPHILETLNSGATWRDVSSNLPQAPINDVVIDPQDPDTLYIATEFGVYTSTDRGGSWRVLGVGLPLVTVLDLDLHEPTMTLAAATYGRSMYRISLNKVKAEAGPRGSQDAFRQTIAEIRTENGEETTIGMVNAEDQPQNVSLFAFAADGKELAQTELVLPAWGKGEIPVSQAFPGLDVAWVQVGSPAPLHVYGSITGPGTATAWWAGTPNSNTAYMPHVARNTDLFETFLATANTGNASLEHNVRANSDGEAAVIREHRLPYGQASRDVRHYLGSDLSDVSFGLLEADSPGAVAMEMFTKLPERDRVASLGLDDRSGTNLHFLHIALDNQRFWTGMVYFNPNAEPVSVEEYYYDADGHSVGQPISRELTPGEKITLLRDHHGSVDVPAEAVRLELRANNNLVGYELFGSTLVTEDHFFAGLQGQYETSERLIFPHFTADDRNWTGLVLVNLGTEAGAIDLTLYDVNGVELENTSLSINAGARVTLLVNSLFGAEALANGAWVKGEGSGAHWAGFQLWGDHNTAVRGNMSGINAGR